MTGDGFGGMIPAFDVRAAADWRRAEREGMSSCRVCGSPDPARLAPDGCSDCTDFDRCHFCDRWVYEPGEGGTGYRWVDSPETQAEVKCCDVCWRKA